MKKKATLKKYAKSIKYISIAIVLLFTLIVVYLEFIVRDIPPIDDTDMEITLEQVPEKANVYPLLWLTQRQINDDTNEELIKRLNALSDKLKNEGRIDDETLNEALFFYREKLEAIKRAADMKYCKGPIVFKPEDRILNFLSLRDFSGIRLELARRELDAGNEKALLEESLRMARFGRLVQQPDGGTTLIAVMVGIAIKIQSLKALNEYLDAGYLPEDSKRVVSDLAEMYESEDVWVNAWKGEYQLLKYVLNQYDSYRMNPNRYFVTEFGFPNNIIGRFAVALILKTERTKKAIYDFDKDLMKNSRVRTYSELDRSIENKPSAVNPISFDIVIQLAKGELGTKLFQAVSTPNFSRAFDRKFLVDIMTDFTRVKIAALQYQKDHGELPKTLGSLVPEYINKIPFDRFDGKPIRYDRNRKLIYSVGMNLADDGGSFDYTIDEKSLNDLREQKDLSLKIMK